MIQKEQIKQYLLQVLNNPSVVSGGSEIACPCPFCGEQRKKLYIGPFDLSDNPIQYNCFVCGTNGYVDQYFLDNCGISTQIDPEVLKSNKGNSYKTKGIDQDIYHNINWFQITDNELSKYKLNYINRRLGTQLTFQDCIDNKIILNIHDLLQLNHINYLTRHQDIVNQLNMYFIGFLSRSNSMLNMRNMVFNTDISLKLHESIQKKYINYKIFQTSASNDFYILPTNIDITKHIRVYIAEGAFDILGIKYNLIKSNDNCIYIAGKGKAYEKALIWLIKTLASYDMEVHYFPDKDVPNYTIKNTIWKFKSAFPMYRFFIHNNKYENEKDYGVPENRISDFMWEEK